MFAIPSFFGFQKAGFAVPATLLLDTYPNAAAAYSVRKLRTAYTGSDIRVRRTDLTEQNIGFVAENLDTTALLAFTGTGALDSGFITTWYDQSGNGYNATQTTALNQSQIVSAGSIITSGSKSSLQNGSTRGSKTGTIPFSSYSEIWLYAVVDVIATTTQIVFESSPNFNTPPGTFLILIDGGKLIVITRNSGYSQVSCPISTGRKLISIKIKTNTTANLAYDIYINNVLQTKKSIRIQIQYHLQTKYYL